MEEQRQRQEDEARKARETSNADPSVKANPIKEEGSEDSLFERALAMSMEEGEQENTMAVDFANMTEEEQIAFAMQMSMQDARNYNFFFNFFNILLC